MSGINANRVSPASGKSSIRKTLSLPPSEACRKSIFTRVEIPDFPRPSRIQSSLTDIAEDINLHNLENPMRARDRRLSSFLRRNRNDRNLIDLNYEIEMRNESVTYAGNVEPYIVDDSADAISLSPSYSKFKMPLEVESRDRYIENIKKYEAQFQHEINQLINYQSTALDAAHFVRVMSNTTLWPPLHNDREMERSKRFFQLTPKEQWRLKKIMRTDYR